MKKEYIKPETCILVADDSKLLSGSVIDNPDDGLGCHNSARGGGFFEDEYEDADDDYGW